jgi:hypothetical protein
MALCKKQGPACSLFDEFVQVLDQHVLFRGLLKITNHPLMVVKGIVTARLDEKNRAVRA